MTSTAPLTVHGLDQVPRSERCRDALADAVQCVLQGGGRLLTQSIAVKTREGGEQRIDYDYGYGAPSDALLRVEVAPEIRRQMAQGDRARRLTVEEQTQALAQLGADNAVYAAVQATTAAREAAACTSRARVALEGACLPGEPWTHLEQHIRRARAAHVRHAAWEAAAALAAKQDAP